MKWVNLKARGGIRKEKLRQNVNQVRVEETMVQFARKKRMLQVIVRAA